MDDLNFMVQTGRDWQTSIQIQARCKHLNLFIGPPGSGKSTVLKHLLGDNSKLSAISTNGNFSIIETEDSCSHLDTYSTASVSNIIAKGNDLYVECPDLQNINLTTSFFLERLLRINRTVQIVVVFDYKTITDNTNDYKVLWSSCLQVSRLMTKLEVIKNVGLIVTKTSGYTEDQITFKCLKDAFFRTVLANCSNSIMAGLDGDTRNLYGSTANMINSFDLQRIGLFKTPVQTGPLHQSLLFASNKIQKIFESIAISDTKDFSFRIKVNSFQPNELRAMAERCHYAILKSLESKIDRFHCKQLLKTSKDNLGNAKILLLRTKDYLDKLYTGRKHSDTDDLPTKGPSEDQQYQVYKHFFVAEILEYHRVIMKFFKRDYDMSMQSIVHEKVDRKMKRLLSLFPRWEKALGFLETVDEILSKDVYQSKRHLYNRKDIVHWGKANVHAQHGLSITAENFKTFCKNISCKFTLENFEEPFGLARLNDIVSEKLHDPFFKFIDTEVEKIQDKEVVLMFANSGGGKTLLQHLQERKLQMKDTHVVTRYPKFVIIDDICYIECPSLEEVRKSENEIQILITIKTILKNCKAVKFLGVVDAKDLKADAKQHLQKCIQSCIAFMPNFEKYSEGLTLIVTKIENLHYYSKNSPEAEVRVVLSQIGVDFVHNTKFRRFIDILLARKDGRSSKIGYFFRLSTDPKLEFLFAHRKKQLEKIIENLSFVPANPNDFHYSLSSKAKIQIFSILVGNHLENYFDNRLSELNCDVCDIDAAINSILESLRAVRDEHLEFNDNCAAVVGEFLKKVFNNFQIDTTIIDETLELIADADGSAALNVVGNMFNNLTQHRCILFHYGFEAVEHYLSGVLRFTTFFTKIHNILSTYPVQNCKTAYQVADAAITRSSDHNIIDHVNLKAQLDHITGHDNFKDDDFQLIMGSHIHHVYQLLSFAISSHENQIETDDMIRVSGNYLVTEKLPRDVLISSKALFLYARNTIFVDKPVSKVQRKVFVIAPTIELRTSPSEMDCVFYVAQNFIEFGKPVGSMFGLYKSERSNEANLLFRYDVVSKTFLDDFIAFLVRGQGNTTFQEKRLWAFCELIESEYERVMKAEHGCDYKKDKYQRAKSLIRHYQYLETLSCQTRDPKELLPRFRDLAKDTAHQFTMDPMSKTILSHLYAALTTKVHSLENDSSQQLILDAKQYLEALHTNIEQYNRASAAREIRRIQAEFKESVIVQTLEGKTFIANQLVRKIDSLYATIDKNMEELLTEVTEEQAKAEGVREELRKKLDQFRQAMVMRNIFATMRGVTTAMGALGVITDKLAKILESGINVTEAITLPVTRIHEMPKYELPHSVNDAIRMQDGMLEKIRHKDLDTLIDNLDSFFQVVDKLPNKNDKIESHIANMQKSLHDFKHEQQGLHDSDKYLRASRIAKAAKALTKDLGNLLQPEQMQQIDILGRNFDSWIGRMHILEEINLIRENLLHVDSDLEKLQQFREKINNSMIPVLNDIQTAYNSCQKDLAKLSEIGLDVKSWQMRSAFVQFKNFCAQFTGGFRMHDHMMDCLCQLEEGLNILLTIHKRFHEFRHRTEIMDYFAQITGAANNVSDIDVVNQLFHDLSMSINESIIIEQYNKGMNGFRQWAFPFAKVYLTDLSVPHLRHESCDPEQRFRSLTVQTIENVRRIIDRTMQHNSSVVSVRDSSVFECRFDGGDLMPVFYTWKSHDFKNEINRILRGEEVRLTSDLESGVRFDAVKFSKIRLEFCAAVKNQQSTVDSYLKDATIQLEHSGRSYYKFRNREFLITTEPVSILYSYASQADGDPIIRNEVYNKLAQHRPVLSPYTEWRVQLNGNFKQILWKDFQLDLKLTGFGQYANVNKDWDLDIEKNYQRYIC